jgi:hypothetical protein
MVESDRTSHHHPSYTHTHTHTHTYMCVHRYHTHHTYTYTHTHPHKHTHTHTHTPTHTHTHTHTHARTRTRAHTHTCTLIHTDSHALKTHTDSERVARLSLLCSHASQTYIWHKQGTFTLTCTTATLDFSPRYRERKSYACYRWGWVASLI